MRKTALMTVAATLALALVGSWAIESKQSPAAAEKIATSVAATGGLVLHPQYDAMQNPQYDGMLQDGAQPTQVGG